VNTLKQEVKNLLNDLEKWFDKKYKEKIERRYRENRTRDYDQLVAADDVGGKLNLKWAPKPDLGVRLGKGTYTFVEVEGHQSPNLNRNVDKYWKLLSKWKEKGEYPKVILVHVLHEKRVKKDFSAEDIAEFVADKIKKEFDFEYLQIYSWDLDEIKEEIRSVIS